jgi:hypothetical protein
MSKSRREFLTKTFMSVFGMAAVVHASEQQPDNPPPGAPPAFGTSPAVGPEVSPGTFAETEKLVQVQLTSAERAEAASNWRNSMAALYERRTGNTNSPSPSS